MTLSNRILTILLLIALWITPVAYGQISVRSSLSNDRTVAPGSSYSGTVLVRNESETIQQAKIYQTDYLFQADGSNQFDTPGTLARSNARWIAIETNHLMIPPLETVELTYRVDVPADSAIDAGTYWSMIMVEGVPSTSPESILNPDAEEAEFGIIQVTRYGIQVATHIEGTGSGQLEIQNAGLVQSTEGVTALRMNILNEGNLMVHPDVWIEVYNADGQAVGRFDGTPSRIYPGTSVRQQISLGDLKSGSYRALVIMDAGDEAVFGAEYSLAVN